MHVRWMTSIALGATISAATSLLAAADPAKSQNVMQLTLQQAIAKATSSSRKLTAARESLEAADAVQSQAFAKFFPTITAEGNAGTAHDRQATPGDTEVPDVPRDRNFYSGQLILTQNIFSGFNHSANYRFARANKSVERLELTIEERQTVLSVVQTYFTLQKNLREVEAEREVIGLKVKQLENIKQKSRSGRATELEELQAQQSLESQRASIRDLDAQIEGQSLKLARLLGMELDQSFALVDSLEGAEKVLIETKLPPLEESYAQLLRESPELEKSEASFERANAQMKLTNSGSLPLVDLVVSAGTDAHQRDEIAATNSVTYKGMVRLTVPLFSGLSSFAANREGQAKINALREERTLLREETLDKLRSAYRDAEVAIDKIKAEQTSVALAEKTTIKAETLQAVGRATLTEVLDSYSARLDAKKKLAAALYQRAESLARIKSMTNQ